jgi:hypothetical protein
MLPPEGQEIFERSRQGYATEEECVRAVKKYLRSPEEKVWLDAQDLSIEDLFNGRYCEQHEQYVFAMFRRWNALIGHQQFFG